MLRNWDRDVLAHLFAENFVILTGDAAEVLCERGLGYLAGIELVRWMKQNEGGYTYEQVTNGAFTRPQRRARLVRHLVHRRGRRHLRAGRRRARVHRLL